jgi:hypothetical protein
MNAPQCAMWLVAIAWLWLIADRLAQILAELRKLNANRSSIRGLKPVEGEGVEP